MIFSSYISSLLLLITSIVNIAYALHFEVPASQESKPICIRDFVTEGQLVVVNVLSDGSVGDGQQLNLYVRDSNGNEFRNKKNFAGEIKVAFTSPSTTSFDVCLENISTGNINGRVRNIELDIESGSEARDWNKISANEKLKPIEVELRRIEELADEIVDELAYLKNREERLRDTNESTNARVRNFSFLIIFVLAGLGAFQINHLKEFFKSKHII